MEKTEGTGMTVVNSAIVSIPGKERVASTPFDARVVIQATAEERAKII